VKPLPASCVARSVRLRFYPCKGTDLAADAAFNAFHCVPPSGTVPLSSPAWGGLLNDEAESSRVADIDVLPSMIVKIDAAQSASDFTSEYDRAVDEVEDELMSEAFQAFTNLDIETAVQKLSKAADVRSRYLALLDQSASDPQHPMSSSIPDLREYADVMDSLRRYFQVALEAFLEYRRGNGPDALRLLDRVQASSFVPELDSLLALQIRVTAENITGLIRRGALDYAGARAAFDRGAAISQDIQTFVSDLSEPRMAGESENADDSEDGGIESMLMGAKFAQRVNEAYSLQMQYAQLMENRNYAGAIDAARDSSSAFREAANSIDNIMPVLAPLVRASSFAALADAGIAEGSLLLEQGEWDAATGIIKTVRDYYQAASRESLRSKHPVASMMQEQYLNTGFSWMIRFRHELDRERSNAALIEELRLELRNFYGSVRGALAPAGVVVNNATEMVTSVKQQVEVTNRVETNIRLLLREVPDALATAGLPAAEREQLGAEALQLADDTSDRTGFFTRVGQFTQKLAAAISKGAELAAPVVALLKALSIIGVII
jgi:hypothetical protein